MKTPVPRFRRKLISFLAERSAAVARLTSVSAIIGLTTLSVGSLLDSDWTHDRQGVVSGHMTAHAGFGGRPLALGGVSSSHCSGIVNGHFSGNGGPGLVTHCSGIVHGHYSSIPQADCDSGQLHYVAGEPVCMWPYQLEFPTAQLYPTWVPICTSEVYLVNRRMFDIWCEQPRDISCPDGWQRDDKFTTTTSVHCVAPEADEWWEYPPDDRPCDTWEHGSAAAGVETCTATAYGRECWYKYGNKKCQWTTTSKTCQADVSKVSCVRK